MPANRNRRENLVPANIGIDVGTGSSRTVTIGNAGSGGGGSVGVPRMATTEYVGYGTLGDSVPARIAPAEFTIPTEVAVNIPPNVFEEMVVAIHRQHARALEQMTSGGPTTARSSTMTEETLRQAIDILNSISRHEGRPVRLSVSDLPHNPPPLVFNDPMPSVITQQNPRTGESFWSNQAIAGVQRGRGRPIQTFHSEGQEPEDL